MSGVAADFPGRYPVLIGTRAFAVNTSYEQFRRQSTHHDTIPAGRESLDLTDVPGEGTINTEGLWRRGAVSWHHGAGQLYLDRKDSDDARFLDSKGIDVWYQNQASLLPDVVQRLNDAGTFNWQTTQVIGATVFALRANVNPTGTCEVQWTNDYVTWTTPTGAPSEILEIAADGTNLYLSSPSGVYFLAPVSGGWAGAAWVQVITDAVDHVFACNFGGGKRIICTGSGVPAASSANPCNQSTLYDITNATPKAPSTLGSDTCPIIMTHIDPNWDWLDATTGEANIYVCGVSGSPGAQVGASTVFQISIESDNNGVFTAQQNLTLTQGTVAFQLNAGEFCGTVFAYAGLIFLGTNLGIRCTRPSTVDDPTTAQGLIAGPAQPNLLHPIQAPFQPYIGNFVSGIIGYGPWVWFSWPQFDGSSWGLGRLDLRTFIADLQPAYASDLMVPSTSTSDNSHHTLNWCPITNGPLISVPQQGLYTQDFNSSISGATKYVASGTLKSGRITWGIPDMKTVAQANLKEAATNIYAPYDAGDGSIALEVAYDDAAYQSLAPLAPNTQANPPTLVSPLTSAEEVQIEVVMTAGSLVSTDDSRPFLSRWTAKALPQVVSGRLIFVAIMLYLENSMDDDLDYSDPYGDYAYLENLRLSQEIITYKEGSPNAVDNDEATCVVQELYWMPFKKRENADGGFVGDLVVTLKTIVG